MRHIDLDDYTVPLPEESDRDDCPRRMDSMRDDGRALVDSFRREAEKRVSRRTSR